MMRFRFLSLVLFIALSILIPVTSAWVPTVTRTSRTSRTTTTILKQSSEAAAPASPSTVPEGGQYTLDGEKIRGPITPLGNFILVRTKEILTATDGGILLPDQTQERPNEGLVLESGPGKIHPFTGIRIPNPIKAGNSVLYGKFTGQPIMYNEEQCQMIRDDDVLLYYDGNNLSLDNAIPYRDNILVEVESMDDKLKTSSGIVIAQQVVADDVPCEGIVVKVGEGRYNSSGKLSKCPYKVGDKVKFKDYAGNDVAIDGKDYSVVKMVDTLCTLNDEVDNK